MRLGHVRKGLPGVAAVVVVVVAVAIVTVANGVDEARRGVSSF